MPSPARALDPILGAKSAYISPGALFSQSWREHAGPALGLELSAALALDENLYPRVLGSLVQWQHEANAERFMVGLEAISFAGVELGLAVRVPRQQETELGLHSSLFLSFGILNGGVRLVRWGSGLEVGLIISLKAPICVAGRYPFEPAGHPWEARGN